MFFNKWCGQDCRVNVFSACAAGTLRVVREIHLDFITASIERPECLVCILYFLCRMYSWGVWSNLPLGGCWPPSVVFQAESYHAWARIFPVMWCLFLSSSSDVKVTLLCWDNVFHHVYSCYLVLWVPPCLFSFIGVERFYGRARDSDMAFSLRFLLLSLKLLFTLLPQSWQCPNQNQEIGPNKLGPADCSRLLTHVDTVPIVDLYTWQP